MTRFFPRYLCTSLGFTNFFWIPDEHKLHGIVCKAAGFSNGKLEEITRIWSFFIKNLTKTNKQTDRHFERLE